MEQEIATWLRKTESCSWVCLHRPKLLLKVAGEMPWDSEDAHLEIRNVKSQEDGQSEFYRGGER